MANAKAFETIRSTAEVRGMNAHLESPRALPPWPRRSGLRLTVPDMGVMGTLHPLGSLCSSAGRAAEQRLEQTLEALKSIVSMQRRHARTGGTLEELAVPQLSDEALRPHAVSFERLGIHVERDYGKMSPILTDRHKLLQILINLLSNARHALVDSKRQEKRLSIRVRVAPEVQRLFIEVADNGTGIAPENLARIFMELPLAGEEVRS